MQRHCDGTDNNLLREANSAGGIKELEKALGKTIILGLSKYRNCDCGLTFNDEERRVIYPHGFIKVEELTEAIVQKEVKLYDEKNY